LDPDSQNPDQDQDPGNLIIRMRIQALLKRTSPDSDRDQGFSEKKKQKYFTVKNPYIERLGSRRRQPSRELF
jgi:hypothetical protein